MNRRSELPTTYDSRGSGIHLEDDPTGPTDHGLRILRTEITTPLSAIVRYERTVVEDPGMLTPRGGPGRKYTEDLAGRRLAARERAGMLAHGSGMLVDLVRRHLAADDVEGAARHADELHDAVGRLIVQIRASR